MLLPLIHYLFTSSIKAESCLVARSCPVYCTKINLTGIPDFCGSCAPDRHVQPSIYCKIFSGRDWSVNQAGVVNVRQTLSVVDAGTDSVGSETGERLNSTCCWKVFTVCTVFLNIMPRQVSRLREQGNEIKEKDVVSDWIMPTCSSQSQNLTKCFPLCLVISWKGLGTIMLH